MIALSLGGTARVTFSIADGTPDATPTVNAYAGSTLLGAATVTALDGTRNYQATYALPVTGIADGTVIEMRANAAVETVAIATLHMIAGVVGYFASVATPANVDDAEAAILAELTGFSDGIAADVLAGLGSVTITRLGPDYDEVTSTITLIQGDDYQGSRGLSFNLELPGVDFTTCTAVFGTSNEGYQNPELEGTATLSNQAVGSATITFTWTRAQTSVKASTEYCWGAVVIDGDGNVQTVISGPLTLRKAKVPLAKVEAAL